MRWSHSTSVALLSNQFGKGKLYNSVKQQALTGHVFELVHCGEDRRITVLKEEDDQQGQSVIVEKGAGTTGITYMSRGTMCETEGHHTYSKETDPAIN